MKEQAVTESGTITREQFYALNGLLALATEHNAALEAITRAAAQITGEGDDGYGYFGLTSDAISEGGPATALLTKLGIEVDDS